MPDIKTDSVKEPTMAELLAAISGVSSAVAVIGTRVDSMEDNFKKKADAEDEKKADAEDEKKDEKADADKDDEKADGEDEKDKKADGEKEDEKADADGKAEDVVADAMKKADEACAKADAATAENGTLRSRIASLEKKMPQDRSDDDHRSMSASQARADSVYELFGRQAPRFLSGESNSAYRRRMVEAFKEHSNAWKPVDLSVLADSAFEIAEEQIYADAVVAAKNSTGVEEGGLRMVPGRTASGHSKTEFFGHPSAWMSRFSGSRRYATQISPNTSKREVA